MNLISASPSRLLLVDSDERFRDSLAQSFSERGFEVLAVGSYERALLALEQTTFSLAVVDIRLRGKSGFEVLRELRDADQTCTSVVLTSLPSYTSALEAGRLGASAYFTKPSSVEEILGACRSPSSLSGLGEEESSSPVLCSLQKATEQQMLRALHTCGGNVTQAARLLGISRRTLHRKLQQHPDLRDERLEARVYRDN